MKLALQIALGIILATLVLWGIALGLTAGVAWWTAEQLNRQIVEQREQESAKQAERQRAEALAKRAEAERKHAAAVRERQAREARLAHQREQNQLLHAFREQYKPPDDCLNPPTESRWVECVDHRRKAKTEFMQQQAMLKSMREPIKIGN
ncbi:hypothetical protein [Parahaliea mediterranea]|uniref:Uncharacterized protein n=1 Tax=Parahaliea mediterranea TaxID=651086 RepID=A0A939DFM0_9GAMM|nr:hypothetical protein [Parahaliea mediterranea]MBN7796642.1 hypothetical protein [Parahaliea mediterranea]